MTFALFAPALACAGEYTQFPGAPIDPGTLRIKEKVEEIYSSGNYDRALLIYEKELAPQGDKYAQYMVGYMHLTGRGIEEDPAAALAWYRLAAERGEPKFIQARDRLYKSLAAAELESSAAIFANLWQRYGDRNLILDLIREDLAVLRERGDPGIAGTDRGIPIVPDYSESGTGESYGPYYERVRAQLSERLEYLNSMPDDPDIGVDDSRVDALEASIRQELRSLDLP